MQSRSLSLNSSEGDNPSIKTVIKFLLPNREMQGILFYDSKHFLYYINFYSLIEEIGTIHKSTVLVTSNLFPETFNLFPETFPPPVTVVVSKDENHLLVYGLGLKFYAIDITTIHQPRISSIKINDYKGPEHHLPVISEQGEYIGLLYYWARPTIAIWKYQQGLYLPCEWKMNHFNTKVMDSTQPLEVFNSHYKYQPLALSSLVVVDEASQNSREHVLVGIQKKNGDFASHFFTISYDSLQPIITPCYDHRTHFALYWVR